MSAVTTVRAALPARYKEAGRRAFLRLAAVANAGEGVSCPCCGRHFRKFARFYGENEQCPGCGSLMRERALTLYLRDTLRVAANGSRALHVGPAVALDQWLTSIDGLDNLSIDIDPDRATLEADVTDLPFDADWFDLVICLHVLEHVPEDRRAIAELFRVLKPGGEAVIQIPPSPLEETFEDFSVTTPAERERVFGQYDHVRICGADYGSRLEEAGFEVEEIDYVAQLDRSTREEFGLHPGEPFFLCTKH